MSDRTSKWVILSQISLLICCLACLGIDSGGLHSRSGLSFYGNFRETLLPYVVGLGLVVGGLVAAGLSLQQRDTYRARYLRLGFFISAACLVGVIVTPSFGSEPIRVVHLLCGIGLFATQAFISVKLVASMHEAWLERWLLGIQIVGVLAAAASFRWVSMLHLMIPAQIVAALSFSGVALQTTKRIMRRQVQELVAQQERAPHVRPKVRDGLTEDDETFAEIFNI